MAKRAQIFVAMACWFLAAWWGQPALAEAAGVAEPETKALNISAIENEQTHAIAMAVLKEAYKKIGYQVEFTELPAKRALIWANEGQTDGDVARIGGTEDQFPNLIQVPTPVIHFQGVAFTRHVNADVRAWKDLASYRLGIINGIRYSDIGTKGMQPLLATDMTHLFNLLDLGRIDIAIAVKEAGLVEIHRHFPDQGIHIIGSPLYEAPLFHFLNKKRAEVVPLINSALTDMKDSGEMESVHRAVLKRLLEE